MPSQIVVSPWKAWEPDRYIRDYYSCGVEPDEQAAIEFQVEFLQRVGRQFPLALEYGCGPTLMRALAASPYVASLDMADRLQNSLRRVRAWAVRDPDADDWTHFTDYVLRCEGTPSPDREAVFAREERTRAVLSGFLLTDARNRRPLGPSGNAAYDLLVSGFCLDCLTRSKDVWRRSMRNVFSVLRPGGAFVILALRGCEGYRFGDTWFPAANIQARDLESALVECRAASFEVAERDLPTHADQGYRGLLMARGWIQ